MERAWSVTLEVAAASHCRLNPSIGLRMIEPSRDFHKGARTASKPSNDKRYQPKGFDDGGLAGVVGAHDNREIPQWNYVVIETAKVLDPQTV